MYEEQHSILSLSLSCVISRIGLMAISGPMQCASCPHGGQILTPRQSPSALINTQGDRQPGVDATL